jgi:hypothetical protein
MASLLILTATHPTRLFQPINSQFLRTSLWRQTAVRIAECHLIQASKSWVTEEEDEEIESILQKVIIKKNCKQRRFSMPLYDSPATANELHETIMPLAGHFCID